MEDKQVIVASPRDLIDLCQKSFPYFVIPLDLTTGGFVILAMRMEVSPHIILGDKALKLKLNTIRKYIEVCEECTKYFEVSVYVLHYDFIGQCIVYARVQASRS